VPNLPMVKGHGSGKRPTRWRPSMDGWRMTPKTPCAASVDEGRAGCGPALARPHQGKSRKELRTTETCRISRRPRRPPTTVSGNDVQEEKSYTPLGASACLA